MHIISPRAPCAFIACAKLGCPSSFSEHVCRRCRHTCGALCMNTIDRCSRVCRNTHTYIYKGIGPMQTLGILCCVASCRRNMGLLVILCHQTICQWHTWAIRRARSICQWHSWVIKRARSIRLPLSPMPSFRHALSESTVQALFQAYVSPHTTEWKNVKQTPSGFSTKMSVQL